MIPEKELNKKLTALKKLSKNVVALSIHDEDSLKKVKEILNKIKNG